MLYQFLGNQGTANIPNTTVLSIVYLLQEAGEYLQEIQVSLNTFNEVNVLLIFQNLSV